MVNSGFRENFWMSRTISVSMAVPFLLFFVSASAGQLHAQQNSLRIKSIDSHWQDPQQQAHSTPDHLMLRAVPDHSLEPPDGDSFTRSPSQRLARNSNIELANYESEEPRQSLAADRLSPNRPEQKLIATANQLPWQDPNRILDLIMKISLNLFFVLSFAFGAILLAKRWLQPNANSKTSDRLGIDSLSVLQTLQLDPKISVRLVQWRSNRFLIACDQNGIQSVNALNESFDQTLTELEAEDQLMAKLLASLENRKQ